MNTRIRQLLPKVVQNPLLEWSVGIILILVSLDELLEAFAGQLFATGVRAEHGLLAYGLLLFLRQSLTVIPYIYIGIVHTVKGVEGETRGRFHHFLIEVSANPLLELMGGLLLIAISGFYAEGAVLKEKNLLEHVTTHQAIFVYGLFTVTKFGIYCIEGLQASLEARKAQRFAQSGWARPFIWLIQHHWLQLIIGALLIIIPLVEVWDALYEKVFTSDLSHHHGAMVIGISTIIKGLPDLYDALEYIDKGIPSPQTESA